MTQHWESNPRTPDLESLSTWSRANIQCMASKTYTFSTCFSGGSSALGECKLKSGSASDIDHVLITGSSSLHDRLVQSLSEKGHNVNDTVHLPQPKKHSSEKHTSESHSSEELSCEAVKIMQNKEIVNKNLTCNHPSRPFGHSTWTYFMSGECS